MGAKVIDLEQARGLLARAVLTQGPDFIYKNRNTNEVCYYRPMNGTEPDFRHDDPRNITGCLVGVALSLAGETRHLEISGSVTAVTSMYPDIMDNETARYFRRAQYRQDSGETWGESYADAERYAVQMIRDRVYATAD